MFANLSETFLKQKMVQSSHKDGHHPEDVPQYFQISINVLEGRKLLWANAQSADSYVTIMLGTKKYRTTIRRNMEEPLYRESFMFEKYGTVREMQGLVLRLAIMEPRCCDTPRVLGEANVDVHSIWAQPNHQVYHKWAQLSLPDDLAEGPVGFVLVDLSITFKGEPQVSIEPETGGEIEDNILLPMGAEQQRANYVITVHGAYGLPASTQTSDRRYTKPPNTFARVSFCGLKATTDMIQRDNNPRYCTEVSMVELFPNICQLVQIEVCLAEGGYHKDLGSNYLKLGQISHDGDNGFVPTFGPSLIHMYATSLGTPDADGPFYRGSLLVTLKTIVPYYQQRLRSVTVGVAKPVQIDNIWTVEEFCIFCPVMEVSMLDTRICGKNCGVAMTIGEIPSENKPHEDFMTIAFEIKQRKLHNTGTLDVIKTRHGSYVEFPKAFPVIQLATRLPDFRFRMYRNNTIYRIAVDLEESVTVIEHRLKNYEFSAIGEISAELSKAANDAGGHILQFLEVADEVRAGPNDRGDELTHQYQTEMDTKQARMQKEEMVKMYQKINKILNNHTSSTVTVASFSSRPDEFNTSNLKKKVKLFIAELKCITENIKSTIAKCPRGWPDIVVWILNGGSRVAYCKIPASDIIYSSKHRQSGRNCGRIRNLYMKPIKCPDHANILQSSCFCYVGKIEVLMWMGLFKQYPAFEKCLPAGYKLQSLHYDMCVRTPGLVLECRVFIYKAKIITCIDNADEINTFVRVNLINETRETGVRERTSKPTWNQVLKINKMIPMSTVRLANEPPMVFVEVYDTDLSKKIDLVGRMEIKPILDERHDYEFAPKLLWHNIYKGDECTGEILISAQILQLQETLLKSIVCTHDQDAPVSPDVQQIALDDIEPLPDCLVPKSTTYKLDIYWWGLRDICITRKPCVVLELDDLIVRSEVIADKKSNCNFPNGRTTHTFKASLDDTYSPPLSIRLYDSSTFGRTLFLGKNIVKKPSKYLLNWIPKNEREESLKSASIISSNFNRMAAGFYEKVQMPLFPTSKQIDINKSNKEIQNKAKRSKLKRLFSKKEPAEEEISLLPVYTKPSGQMKLVKTKSRSPEEKDWWYRFICSQKEQIQEYMDEDEHNTNKIIIYNTELENQSEFSKFKDWCSTLKFYNGKKTGIPEKDEQLNCGFLKAGIAIYKWPPPRNITAVSTHGVDLHKGYFDDYPKNDTSKLLVRVYVVRADNIVSNNYSGKSDPYVTVSCGKIHLGDRLSYESNTHNPIFGKMFEFLCTLPDDYLLNVSLYDHQDLLPDEIIGNTVIDLEDRVYSKHRACVGLSEKYFLIGPQKWRDCVKPSEILEELCLKNYLPRPIYSNANTVLVNGVEYKEQYPDKIYSSMLERKENICLSLLRDWHTLPICGYHLVPEHVETRVLYNPNKPGVERGKVVLWVDVFPLDAGMFIPPPTDVTPRKLEKYELRVIVWSVFDVKFSRLVKMPENDTSDIYVKAWIGSSKVAQNTDSQYRNINGEGKFNWRMIFDFQYQPLSKKMLLKEKGPFTEVEEYIPAVLVVQVLESGLLIPEDFLGSLTLNLNTMPRGTKLPKQCTPDILDKSELVDLFTLKFLRAWWPLKYLDRETGKTIRAGAIDLELSLYPKEKADTMRVGFGRNPPCPLPEPPRPQYRFFSRTIMTLDTYMREKRLLLAGVAGGTVVAGGIASLLYYCFISLLDRVDLWPE